MKKSNKTIIIAADKTAFQDTAKRVIRQTITASTVIDIKPSVSLTIGGKNIKEAISKSPYGILPFVMSASKEELINMALAFEATKYALTEKGQYKQALLYGWRQNLIEGVLSGMTTFNLNSL